MMIYVLNRLPWFISEIAEIYIKEWGWFYSEEYNINTRREMIEYIYNNYMKNIYLLVTDNYEFVGTIMLTDNEETDDLNPWVSCLYIHKIYNKELEYKYSNMLIEHLQKDELYTWFHEENDFNKYLELGFFKINEYEYNNYVIYVMKKKEFVLR